MTSDSGQFETFNVVNDDPTEWKNGYNKYVGIFTVTQSMANAAFLYFKIWGPAKDYDIVFDNLKLEPSYPALSTCHEVSQMRNNLNCFIFLIRSFFFALFLYI